MKKYIYRFQMYTSVVEETTVEAGNQQQAEAVVRSGNCEWEEIKSQGGDWELVGEEEVSDE